MSLRAIACSLAASCAVLAGAAPARAQQDPGFSERGRVVVVADNLAGFVHEDISYPNNGAPNSSTGGNVWGFFPYAPIARFGVHGFVAGGLRLGGGNGPRKSDRNRRAAGEPQPGRFRRGATGSHTCIR